jgi:hypothetical protein
MTSDASEAIELLRFGEENAPVVVSLSKYKGMRFIDIRRYYFDKNSKTTKPTPKGIALKEDEFGILATFLNLNLNLIQKQFTTELNSIETATRGTALEKKAGKKVGTNTLPASVEVSSWPALEFFSVDETAASSKVNFNKKIKFISTIEKDSPEFLNYLKDFIIAYNKAKKSLHFTNKQKPADVLENIELEWARNLNVQQ